MPCAVKSSFNTGLHISLQRSILQTPISLLTISGLSILQTPISLLTKTGFHASNWRSLLSEFELWNFDMHYSFYTYFTYREIAHFLNSFLVDSCLSSLADLRLQTVPVTGYRKEQRQCVRQKLQKNPQAFLLCSYFKIQLRLYSKRNVGYGSLRWS